ncbi:MAG: hypothetical protein ABJT05_17610, partial [Paracoccaceae bacterium]
KTKGIVAEDAGVAFVRIGCNLGPDTLNILDIGKCRRAKRSGYGTTHVLPMNAKGNRHRIGFHSLLAENQFSFELPIPTEERPGLGKCLGKFALI